MKKIFKLYLTVCSILAVLLITQLPVLAAASDNPIRVVCVGDSITAGYGTSNGSTKAWPAQMSTVLGKNYSVLNCGVSGTTMLKNGTSPYWNTPEFTKAKNFDPQILIIGLGTNDAWPGNWNNHKGEFYNDYVAMINQFRANGRNPQIYVCFPAPIFGVADQNANLKNELIPIILKVRDDLGTSYIDFNGQMANYSSYFPDGMHPNDAGALIMAKVAFEALTPSVPTFYQDASYGGYAVPLGVSDYNTSQLIDKGIQNDDISSIKVPAGYKVIVYADDNFSGNSVTLTASNDNLSYIGWNNVISSIKVVPNGVTGKSGTYLLQNRNSSLYMDVDKGSNLNGANIIQWSSTGGANQKFKLTDVGNGAYSIINVQSGKAIDVAYGSTDNLAKVLQYDYSGNYNQRFILMSVDNGYYKLKAVNSGRILEIGYGNTSAGSLVDQYDDNNQLNGHWNFIPVQ